MYRQGIMEAEQQQIFSKLGELPIVNDTCAQVLNMYERTKGHNLLFRTSLGLAEYTAKAVAGRTVPILYNGLQTHIDKVNDMACTQLEALEEKYPIITKPTEEIWREGQSQYNKVKPIVDPLIVKPAKVAVGVGKTAVTMGTSVASTAMKPAVMAVNVGSAVMETGKNAVSQVTSGVVNGGKGALSYGLDRSGLGELLLKNFDQALDTTEVKIYSRIMPSWDEDEFRETAPHLRSERVRLLTETLHNFLVKKTKADLTRYRMMAFSLLNDIKNITAHYVELTRDGAEAAWKDRDHIVAKIDSAWNSYAHYVPEQVRPTDPMKQMALLLGTLTEKIGEMFPNATQWVKVTGEKLPAKCQEFVEWCQRSASVFKEGDWAKQEKWRSFMSQLVSYLPEIKEMVQSIFNKVLDSVDILGLTTKWRRQKVAKLEEEHQEEEGEEIEMKALEAVEEEQGEMEEGHE